MRRKFSFDYKLQILAEVESCEEKNQIRAVLYREKITSSFLSRWRKQKVAGQLDQDIGELERRNRCLKEISEHLAHFLKSKNSAR